MCARITPPPAFPLPHLVSRSSPSACVRVTIRYPLSYPLYPVFSNIFFLKTGKGRRIPREYLDTARISSKKMENCVSNVAPTCDTTLSAIVTPWRIRRSLDLVGSKSNFSTSGGTMNGRRLGGAHCADISTRCVVVAERTRPETSFLSPGALCVSSIRPCRSTMEHYWRMHGCHEPCRHHLFRGRD